MKRLFLSASVLTLFASGAFAADLTTFEAAPVIEPVVAATPWTGAYIGAQLGYAWGGDGDDSCFEVDFNNGDVFGCEEYNDVEFGTEDVFDPDGSDDDSFFAGGHLGYDHQIGNLVIGGVAEVNWLFGDDDDDDDDDNTFDIDAFDPGFDQGPEVVEGFFPTITLEDDEGIDWYGTARLRAGFAAGNFLIYGTGGLAFGGGGDSGGASAYFATDDEAGSVDYASLDDLAEFEDGCDHAVGDAGPVVCNLDDDDDDDTNFGWALGAGVDFLATSNFSIGLEYLYVNLGNDDDDDEDFAFDFEGGETLEFDGADSDNDFHTVSVRGSYRFNFGG